MEKTKKMDKTSLRNQIQDPGVGYVWGRYKHPHNARPKTVPLIK